MTRSNDLSAIDTAKVPAYHLSVRKLWPHPLDPPFSERRALWWRIEVWALVTALIVSFTSYL